MATGCFLVVDDEPLVVRAIGHVLSSYGEVISAVSIGEGMRKAPARDDWSAFIIDVKLKQECGLDLLPALRAIFPDVPVLVLTSSRRGEHINAACAQGARYLSKPFKDEELRAFASDAISVTSPWASHVDRVIDGLQRAHRWTPHERRIVASKVRGVARRDFLDAEGINENTHKSQARSLIRKTSGTNDVDVRHVRDYVLRKTWAGST